MSDISHSFWAVATFHFIGVCREVNVKCNKLQQLDFLADCDFIEEEKGL